MTEFIILDLRSFSFHDSLRSQARKYVVYEMAPDLSNNYERGQPGSQCANVDIGQEGRKADSEYQEVVLVLVTRV